MSKYIGQIKHRITIQVEYLYSINWTQPAYGGYGYDEYYRHIFKTAEGDTLTWKTMNLLGMDDIDADGYSVFRGVTKGSLITIKGTVKAHTEYKDELQTELTRVKVISIDKKAPTPEEITEAKVEEQLKSLKEGDRVETMLYSRYKKHYSDCEVIVGSFDNGEIDYGYRTSPTVKVILRAGREKPSGVRGEHFSGYELTNEVGKHVVYRAVSEENAIKRAYKEFPKHTWECTKIYDYRDRHRIF